MAIIINTNFFKTEFDAVSSMLEQCESEASAKIGMMRTKVSTNIQNLSQITKKVQLVVRQRNRFQKAAEKQRVIIEQFRTATSKTAEYVSDQIIQIQEESSQAEWQRKLQQLVMKLDNVEQTVLLENLRKSQSNENADFPTVLLEAQLHSFITQHESQILGRLSSLNDKLLQFSSLNTQQNFRKIKGQNLDNKYEQYMKTNSIYQRLAESLVRQRQNISSTLSQMQTKLTIKLQTQSSSEIKYLKMIKNLALFIIIFGNNLEMAVFQKIQLISKKLHSSFGRINSLKQTLKLTPEQLEVEMLYEIIKKKDKQIYDLQEENLISQSQLTKVATSNKLHRLETSKLNQLDEKVDEINQNVVQYLELELDELRQELKQVKSDKQMCEKQSEFKIKQLFDDIFNLNLLKQQIDDEVTNLRNQLKISENDKSQIKLNFQKQIDELLNKCQKQEVQVSDFQHLISDYKENSLKTNQQLQALRGENSKLQIKISDINQQKDIQKDEFQQELKICQNQINLLKNRLSFSQSQVSIQNQQQFEFELSESFQASTDHDETSQHTYPKRLRQSYGSKGKQQVQKSRLAKQQYDCEMDQNSQLQDSIFQLQAQIAEIQMSKQEKISIQNQNSQLKDQLDIAKRKNIVLQQDISQLQQKNSKLQSEIQFLQSKVSNNNFSATSTYSSAQFAQLLALRLTKKVQFIRIHAADDVNEIQDQISFMRQSLNEIKLFVLNLHFSRMIIRVKNEVQSKIQLHFLMYRKSIIRSCSAKFDSQLQSQFCMSLVSNANVNQMKSEICVPNGVSMQTTIEQETEDYPQSIQAEVATPSLAFLDE